MGRRIGDHGRTCVFNALRCGRVHCYVTGPFFLGMAIVALLYGLGVISLGTEGWNFIGGAVIIGAVVLIYLPEAFLGCSVTLDRRRPGKEVGSNREIAH